MNLFNLSQMAYHLDRVPEELFDMTVFNSALLRPIYPSMDDIPVSAFAPSRNNGTRGCALACCTVLNTAMMREIIMLQGGKVGRECYYEWCERFTGVKHNTAVWSFMFNAMWAKRNNRPEAARSRILAVINGKMHEHKDYSWFIQRYNKGLPRPQVSN